MIPLLVVAGAAVGAPLRFATDRFVQARHDSVFPWGTWVVNVVGSLVLGLVVGAGLRGRAGPELLALVGTGFCGALTTYSTFGYETLRLVEDGSYLAALVNVLASVAAGLLAAAAGLALATLLLPPAA
ncbi:MAG: fluoride efflux transporter CrcB [Actinomycetota bacterium]